MVRVNLNLNRAAPCCIGRASPPIVFAQPNGPPRSLMLLLADRVAGVARGAGINCRTAVGAFWAMCGVTLRCAGRRRLARTISLVGAQRESLRSRRMAHRHLRGCLALDSPVVEPSPASTVRP